MKFFTCLSMMFLLISIMAHAAMYEWKDEKGVVNFTDNPEKIPAKYKKRVKKRPSIGIDSTESATAPAPEIKQKTPDAVTTPMKEKELTYGGHNEEWWRSSFVRIREELKNMQDRLPEKKQDLEIARRKMTIYQYPKYRQAYYDLKSEIEKDGARIEELNNQLQTLDNDASKAAVPFDWRK